MKRFVLGAAALLLVVPGLRAQDDAAKRAKVEELFTVMRLQRTMDQLMAAVRQQAETMMQSTMQSMPGGHQLTPEQKRITEEFQNKVMSTVMQSVGWKAMEPDMVNLYANAYSAQEIDGLIAFYQSPIGQAYLDKTPELTQKSMEITQQKVLALQPKMQGLIQDYAQQMSAAARPTGANTPKPKS